MYQGVQCHQHFTNGCSPPSAQGCPLPEFARTSVPQLPSQPAGTEPPSSFRSGSFLRESYTVPCRCLWRNWGPPGLSCLRDAGSPRQLPGPLRAAPAGMTGSPGLVDKGFLPSPRESGVEAQVSHLGRRQRALTSCHSKQVVRLAGQLGAVCRLLIYFLSPEVYSCSKNSW